MKENKLVELSMSFSVDILNQLDTVKGHKSIVNQLERSATSIGANIHEANYAHSKADFVSKMEIALKESFETEYWLELFSGTNLLPPGFYSFSSESVRNNPPSSDCLNYYNKAKQLNILKHFAKGEIYHKWRHLAAIYIT